jgi:hypothetical protein
MAVKKAWAGPLALWTWGGPRVREEMAAEAARKRVPLTVAQAMYPNLKSEATPAPPKKQEPKR